MCTVLWYQPVFAAAVRIIEHLSERRRKGSCNVCPVAMCGSIVSAKIYYCNHIPESVDVATVAAVL